MSEKNYQHSHSQSAPKSLNKMFKKEWKSNPSDINPSEYKNEFNYKKEFDNYAIDSDNYVIDSDNYVIGSDIDTHEYSHQRALNNNHLFHTYRQNELSKKREQLKKKKTFSNFKDNNSWNSQLERITKDIGEKADGIKWMHDHDSSVLTLIDNILGILTIVFGVLSIIPSALMGLDQYKDVQLVFLINIALSVITALFAGLKQFLPLKDMSDKHKSAAGRYLQLRNLVKLQLALYRKDRENGKTFVATLQREFNVLFSTSPSITTWTSWRFSKKFKNIEMTKPDAIDGITPIDIRQTTKDSSPNTSNISNPSNTPNTSSSHIDKDHNNDINNINNINNINDNNDKYTNLRRIDLNNNNNHINYYQDSLNNNLHSGSCIVSSHNLQTENFIDLEKGEGTEEKEEGITPIVETPSTERPNSLLHSKPKGSVTKKSSKKKVETNNFDAYNVEKSEEEISDDEPDKYITKTDRRQQYEIERFLKSSN